MKWRLAIGLFAITAAFVSGSQPYEPDRERAWSESTGLYSRSETNDRPKTPRRIYYSSNNQNQIFPVSSTASSQIRANGDFPQPTTAHPETTQTTTATESSDNLQLRKLEENVSDWMQKMETKEKQNFEQAKSLIYRKVQLARQNLQEFCRTQAANNKGQQPSPCPDTVEAITDLLDKMSAELDVVLKKQITHSQQDKANIPEPSSILGYLLQLESRLEAMDVEISSEIPDEKCTLPLSVKAGDLKNKLDRARRHEKQRLENLTVENGVEGIRSGVYTSLFLQLKQLEARTGDYQALLALGKIVDMALNENWSVNNRFERIMAFINTLEDRSYRKTCIKVMLKYMEDSGTSQNIEKSLTWNNMLRLAYEAKIRFGDELRKEFPPSFQNLIWNSTKQCLQSGYNQQYLSVQNTTAVLLPVETVRYRNNSTTEPSKICRWNFYPVVADESYAMDLPFIIRQGSTTVHELNLNAMDHMVYVSSAMSNSDFMWLIEPKEQGQAFSLRLFLPEQSSAKGTHAYSNLKFLCVDKTSRDEGSVHISTFNEKCRWFFNSSFGM